MAMDINNIGYSRVSSEQVRPTPNDKNISPKPDFSHVGKMTVFGLMFEKTMGWVPGLIAAPFTSLIGDTSHWSPSKVAKLVLLSPLALVASVTIAGNLLYMAPIIGATALVNAAVAARKGEDLASRQVMLYEHKGELKLDLQSIYAPKTKINEKQYDEMGNVITTEKVKYKDILRDNKTNP